MGFSGATLTLTQMENLIKTTLAIEIMYYVLIFSIKISILFFYLRIGKSLPHLIHDHANRVFSAVDKNFERACWYTIHLLSVFCVICVICCLTQCIPLHKMWDLTGLVQGHCINTTALFYCTLPGNPFSSCPLTNTVTSSFNILTDIWILALPVKTLLGIQRPNREKFALIVVFSLGVFSCIASIVRLHSIRIYTESKDPFYDSVPINLWSMIEVNIGIWCASIPALKALISRGQRERSRATGYKYHSRDKSGPSRISAKKTGGGSSTDGSQGTVHGNEEAFDMKYMQDQPQPPRQAARKPSNIDSERSGSEENIFLPGAYNRV
jgi:hypothetical protein